MSAHELDRAMAALPRRERIGLARAAAEARDRDVAAGHHALAEVWAIVAACASQAEQVEQQVLDTLESQMWGV